MKIEIKARVIKVNPIEYSKAGALYDGVGNTYQNPVDVVYELFINDQLYGRPFDKDVATSLANILELISTDENVVERNII